MRKAAEKLVLHLGGSGGLSRSVAWSLASLLRAYPYLWVCRYKPTPSCSHTLESDVQLPTPGLSRPVLTDPMGLGPPVPSRVRDSLTDTDQCAIGNLPLVTAKAAQSGHVQSAWAAGAERVSVCLYLPPLESGFRIALA